MSKTLKIRFKETDIQEKEAISFHIPHSKKLDPDHLYFKKRLIWTLTKSEDTQDYPYAAIEEDEKNGIRYSEIMTQMVTEINGISNEEIRDALNSGICFDFDYIPNEHDRLVLQSDYEFKAIKAINRPVSCIFKHISFSYKNGQWKLVEMEVEKRLVKKS